MLPCTGVEARQKQTSHIAIPGKYPVSLTERDPCASRFQHLYTGSLSFFNVHTKKSIRIRYLKKNGEIDPHACKILSHFFKSPHDGKKIPINTSLFLMLDALRNKLGAKERHFLLFSGYRSPAYNRLLRKRDGDVARNSYHVKGMAADIGLEGVLLRDIEKVAKGLSVGGVGRYDKFVHLDVGPVRCWRS
jgi:uncharacterized protein YcbK (DUF882 family)